MKKKEIIAILNQAIGHVRVTDKQYPGILEHNLYRVLEFIEILFQESQEDQNLAMTNHKEA